MRYLGIDYGSKRIGLATSDESGTFAFPHSVIDREKNTIQNIRKIIETDRVGKIILGESKNLKGEPNPIQAEISAFKKELEREFSLPVFMESEFFTSASAERIQGKGDKLDASAAAVILQSYLDKQQ